LIFHFSSFRIIRNNYHKLPQWQYVIISSIPALFLQMHKIKIAAKKTGGGVEVSQRATSNRAQRVSLCLLPKPYRYY
jgi:hypothetical protein